MADLKSERISAAVLLTYATVTYTSILCFELYGLRPSYAEAYSEVSSFFGIGAYLAWWLTALSVVMRPDSPEAPFNPSWLGRLIYRPDIVTSTVYVILAAINTIIRVVPRSRNLAEVDAGLTVLEAGADLCIVYLFVTVTEGFTRVLTIGLPTASNFVHHVSPIANQLSLPSTSSNNHPITSLTLEHRNYSFAAGVNLVVVLFGTTLWILVKNPLEIAHQRLIIACALGILWLISNENGTYKIMPRSSTTLDQLDQWAALAVAILLVLFSWIKELRDLVDRFKNQM